MRSIWSGSISFGLVNIPIKLYSASKERKISFNLLHKEDFSPIRFARVCRADGQEIPYEDIVKGYQYQKGDYIVLEEEDFEKVDQKKTKSIEISGFVDLDEIDPIYFEKPYFLEPTKGAEKAYVLLREALKKTQKVGLGKFVLRNKEHLAVVKPFQQGIILNQLRFQDELSNISGLNMPEKAKVAEKEIDLAIALIEQLSQSFQPEQYTDTYTQDLEELIQEKVEGKVPAVKGKAPEPTPVKDLMTVLKQSLEQAKTKPE